jgi:hypothetical protein
MQTFFQDIVQSIGNISLGIFLGVIIILLVLPLFRTRIPKIWGTFVEYFANVNIPLQKKAVKNQAAKRKDKIASVS